MQVAFHNLNMVAGGERFRPFLVPEFHVAMTAAVVVLLELAAITWIRHHYMDTPPLSAALQVGLGGALVFVTGVLIGNA
jgi:hypothetical protein